MKLKQLKFILILIIGLPGFLSTSAQQKLENGIMVELKKEKTTDAQIMKVEVCTDEIIHVTAAPGKEFSNRKSLMVNKTEWPEVKWDYSESGNSAEIATAKLKVIINKETGAVAFYDHGGKLLLQEKESGGKIISSSEVLGEQVFNIQQVFESPDDEAFYGLGAHQNNVWNYKGHDIDLWQYNIIDVVPFLASNKSYGILWDNNSRTKFGDIREYQSLSTMKLYGTDGKEGGLTTEYFNDTEFKDVALTQSEPRIEHEFLDVNDSYPEGSQQKYPAIRWSGEIEAKEPGINKFRLYCCGYTKMWLDGKLVVDSWRQNWLPWTHMINLNMEPGKKYSIKIEWIHTGGYIGLKCLSPEDESFNNKLSLYSEVADQIDYYFVYGENADQVIKGYREITGKVVMLPKWAMGFWQSRERYKTQDEILSTVQEFRDRKIPFDNIVLDWFYWEEDKWGDHDFDKARFADPEGMIKKLHNDLNAQIMISVWPKFYTNTEHYRQFKEKGWLYMRNVEKKQKDWVGPGYESTFYDAYNDDARLLYWDQIDKKLFMKGIDAWWLDSTEPDIHSNLSREEIYLRQGPTALGNAARYLNTYSLMTTKGVYEGQRKSDPNKRVFILTRSAFAGQQRNAATTWSGDVAARWYDLKAQVPAGLNFCLSGLPYWTTDIGGFSVEPRYERPTDADLDEWRELNTRWFQFGTFCPLFRVHGQFPYREMYNIAPDDHPAYQTMVAYDKLRYRLMPYIYSLSGMVTQNDYTIMRALIMDFSKDSKVHSIGDQYMFGPALLINPVTDYKARSRSVYLPSGTGWYDFYTGKYYDGGQSIEADAPYTQIPLFVKAGSVIPCGPEIQYAMEKPADPVRIFVYTGSNSTFTIYEDENINYNYEKGMFSKIDLVYDDSNKELTVSERQGEFPGMLKNRTFEIIWISSAEQSGLDFERKADAIINYDGNKASVKMQ